MECSDIKLNDIIQSSMLAYCKYSEHLQSAGYYPCSPVVVLTLKAPPHGAIPHGAIDSQENTRLPRNGVNRILWQAIRAKSSVSETGQSYDPEIRTCSI